MENLGRLLLILGAILAVLGLLLMLGSSVPFLRNLGRLPGDIRFTVGNFTCFFPIVTSIVLSITLTVALNIILRLMR